MKISAHVHNRYGHHEVTLTTSGQAHTLAVPPKSSGFGSSANGGELLFLALATCYCNDVYREAAKAGIEIESVTVEVEGAFDAVGEPAHDITYRAHVIARDTPVDVVRSLLVHTDGVAEIQNTLREGVAVRLVDTQVEVVA